MTLQRLTGKVFAGNADLTDLGVFGSALSGTPTNPTGTNTEAQIQADAAYEEGWTDAVVTTKNFPPIEEVNGVLRTISYQTCYLLQEGIPEWDANTEYSNTSVVKVINGQQLDFYISQQTQSGNIPQSDNGTSWKKAIITGDREIGVPQITLNFNMVLPDGYVDLIGQEESKTGVYSNLYSIYGNNYNLGNEASGNFRFPDFRGRALYGGASAGYIDQGLPDLGLSISDSGAHTHTASTGGGSAHRHGMGNLSYNSSGKLNYIIINEDVNFTRSGNITLTNNAIDTSNKYGFDGDSSCRKATLNVDVSGGTWSGNMATESSHTHSVTVNSTNSSHSHTINHNRIIGSTDKIYTDGIKVRVFTRYK